MSKMRKASVFIAILLLVTVIITIVPLAGSQEVDVEWFEDHSFEGNCSSKDNVLHRFWVNGTVVEIDINVSWPQSYGADINFWLEDSIGFNVKASESKDNPDTLTVREFPDRGRWKLVVYPESCGSGSQVNYTVNITVRHVVLPVLVLSTHKITEGEHITFNVTTSYEQVSQYFLDFRDGANTGWSEVSEHTITYNKSGDYVPRAKVRYTDGTESDWVEAGAIEVTEGPNMVLWIGFWLLLIGLLSFGVNLLYSKRKGI